MAKVFKTDKKEKKIIEIIRDTLDVNSSGAVTFRSRTGRGSGSGIEIPGDQFDTFVEFMLTTQKARNNLVKEESQVEPINDDIEVIVVE